MAQKAELIVTLKDRASKGLGLINSSLKKVGKTVLNVAKVGFAALTVALGLSIKNAERQNKVLAQMDAVLESTGHAANLTKKEIVDLSKELQKQTGIGNEVIQTGENMLLTFKNIKGDTFKRATIALVDMNAAMTEGKVTSESLRAQAIQLGKALNDPIAGISALSRVGVQFTEEQKEQIKVMVASGKTVEAQTIILKELESQFGGTAAKMGTALDKTKARFGDVSELLGNTLMPILEGQVLPAFNRLLGFLEDFLEPGRIANWFRQFQIAFLGATNFVKRFNLQIDKAIVGFDNMVIASKKAGLKIKGVFKDTTDEIRRLERQRLENNIKITSQELSIAREFAKKRKQIDDEYNASVEAAERLRLKQAGDTASQLTGIQTDQTNTAIALTEQQKEAYKELRDVFVDDLTKGLVDGNADIGDSFDKLAKEIETRLVKQALASLIDSLLQAVGLFGQVTSSAGDLPTGGAGVGGGGGGQGQIGKAGGTIIGGAIGGPIGAAIGGFLGGLLPFQEGGIVPGNQGKPLPILAHGGERVISNNDNKEIVDLLSSINKKLDNGGMGNGRDIVVKINDREIARASAKYSNSYQQLNRTGAI
jgi:hypothetical protein